MSYRTGDTSGKCHMGQEIPQVNVIWDRRSLRQMSYGTGDPSGKCHMGQEIPQANVIWDRGHLSLVTHLTRDTTDEVGNQDAFANTV